MRLLFLGTTRRGRHDELELEIRSDHRARPGIETPLANSPTRRSTGMAAKETKTEAVAAEKPTTRAAAPEITQEMIAERAYHISQSGEGGTDEENWHQAEGELQLGSDSDL
jgi:hypothetical protein